MKKSVGTFLLIAGVIGGVMAASKDPIHQSLFGISVGVMILGTALRRGIGKNQREESGDEGMNVREVRSVTGKLLSELGELAETHNRVEDDYRKSVRLIESLLSHNIPQTLSLVSKLEGIMTTTDCARITSLVSEGERYLNRAWSALMDGYETEAKNSLLNAYKKLGEASSILASVATAP
ncbi:MAG: hypothetical protein ACE5OP_13205 [Candidatus Glassbacteria bacterium]